MLPFVDSRHEALYSKCLFRTIGFKELKNEIDNFKIASTGESYYVMCLKLRLDILKRSNCSDDIIKSIREELDSLDKTKSGYFCSYYGCHFVPTRNYDKLLHHLKTLHIGNSQKILCQLNGCRRELSSVAMLNVHIKTCHRVRKNSFCIKQNQISEQLTTLHCPSSSCGHQQVASIRDLKVHITRDHTDQKQEVFCIFRGCDFKTQKSSTFKSHISKNHRLQLINDLKTNILSVEELEDNDIGVSSYRGALIEDDDAVTWSNDHFSIDSGSFPHEHDSYTLPEEDDGCVDDEELFTRALAITYNTWANINHVPYSTVNQIVAEVFTSYQQGVDYTKRKILSILLKDGIESDRVKKMLENMEDDPFCKAKAELESERKRENYLLSSFRNVLPETVKLSKGNSSSKSDTMQYISLKKTLKQLLEDQTYIDQKKGDPYFHEAGFIKDVRDGSKFRTNEFFIENPEAVPLLIFQDELEVVNPLGAGKSRHKIQCTYWTSLEVIPAIRTRIKSIQLCSLVLSRHWKKYGNAPTMQNMLQDLKELETEGILVEKPSQRVVKAGLVLVVGDNLGQHQLAEMNSVFSSGFICRYCNATYDDVCKNKKIYSGCDDTYATEQLTEQKYDMCADLAEENGQSSTETCGIKGHCILNTLQSFHCASSMAPCLGHDYFEGVFAHDAQFLLNYILNKEKLMSVDEFNEKISRFRLSARDSRNRPKHFKSRPKYEGSAGSLRILSRILTTILSDVLEDSATEMYFIKLHEIGEIITAPALTLYEIEYVMKDIIEEYLDLRVKGIEELGMPRPRPKHHMLSHYPSLYIRNGPLIDVWAMRMESKHTFFKAVIRTSKNFKNVALTCAKRHQMAQISYFYYGLFPRSKFDLPADSPNVKDVSLISQDREIQKFYSTLHHTAVIPKKITIYGTEYGSGQILILDKLSLGVLKVGIIKAIEFSNNEASFFVSTFEALQSKFGYYLASKDLCQNEVVNYTTLCDHHPLELIGSNSCFIFVLHHFVSIGSGNTY